MGKILGADPVEKVSNLPSERILAFNTDEQVAVLEQAREKATMEGLDLGIVTSELLLIWLRGQIIVG